jgi:cyclic 2,3-diphosphoglycerate synthase
VSTVRAVALVDGEHYPDVVREALEALPYEWVGVILVGGTEKLRATPEYGVPIVDGFEHAEVVVDLSDEPVLGPAARLRWASRALAEGLPYIGADFRFDPPALEPFELPSVSVIGTGKRVGKTAVTGHLARLLSRDRDVVVVAMGRGGPPEPEIVAVPPTVEELVARSRAGRHAASDHLETAATCGVPTIGCRRAGGGLAGAVFRSNVADGARLAAERNPDVVIFDGSGAAIPPIATDRRVLVVGPEQDVDAYLNTYRRLISDLVIAVNCEVDGAVPVTLRLRPAGTLTGRVAVFTAGGSDVSHLDADVVSVSTSLADRAALARDLASVDADTYLVEVKAAAIDVVAEHALAHDRRIVLASNDVVSRDRDLDAALLDLVPAKVGTR